MNYKCFLLEPTDQYVVSLRRYPDSAERKCPKHPHGYCNAVERIDIFTWDGKPKKLAAGGNGTRGERAYGWGGDPVKCDGPL